MQTYQGLDVSRPCLDCGVHGLGLIAAYSVAGWQVNRAMHQIDDGPNDA